MKPDRTEVECDYCGKSFTFQKPGFWSVRDLLIRCPHCKKGPTFSNRRTKILVYTFITIWAALWALKGLLGHL